jgi:ABC-type multidrug transport system ATPase subunit
LQRSFSYKEQAMLSKKENELIRKAIISIYVHLARIRHLTKTDIGMINNMLRSVFQTGRTQTLIGSSSENLLSIRQATNILKMYLNFADKIRLIINLLSIAYTQQKDFRILCSLEIIKIVDLLYIDINTYDNIVDVLEQKKSYIKLPINEFSEKKPDRIFSDIMHWSSLEIDDVFFRDKPNSKLIFMMFHNMILVCGIDCSKLSFGEKVLSDNKFHVMTDKDILQITDVSGNELQVSDEDLRCIYNGILEKKQRTYHIKENDTDLNILQEKGKLVTFINTGTLYLNNKKATKKASLAINDFTNLEGFKTGRDVLCDVLEHSLKKDTVTKYYLDEFEKFYRISYERSGKTIAKFEKVGNETFITPSWNQSSIFLNNVPVSGQHLFLNNKDVISINKNQFKINSFLNILKIDYDINEFSVSELYHTFDDGTKALDGINFSVNQNELMVIMGPSGSGKTTLLKSFVQEIFPKDGEIKIDGHNLLSNFSFFQKFIGYVPQDDLLFSNLTVYDNLYFSAKLRLPHIKEKAEIDKRINIILKQTDLFEKRDTRAGDVMHKSLSGGQRKRLNIALELLSDPLIIFLDEPTSGLSSKDSEKLVNILLDLKEQGKIIVATIHQPNSDLFLKFNKILFLDKNGTQVFFGNTNKVFDYFDEELEKITFEKQNLLLKKQYKMPEYLFDILEYPNETSTSWHNSAKSDTARKFPPSYWNEKYHQDKLFEIISKEENPQENTDSATDNAALIKEQLSLVQNFSQFYNLFYRNIKNKFTNKINLGITFIAAPVLALLVAVILRFQAEGSTYSYYKNENVPMFIFMSVIIFIFLGLANSLDEILSEKRIVLREKKLNIKTIYYLLSKNITLSFFNLIQVVLYVFIASVVLQLRGIFLVNILFLFLAGMIGFSIGLVASAFIQDRKAIINILPIVIIPQIMFAGAVIKFDSMNPILRINSNASVPEFCEIIPSKWLFEGMMISYSTRNSYDYELKRLNHLRNSGYSGTEVNRRMNILLEKRVAENYRNEEIKRIVNNQNGDYLLNENKNFFLTENKRLPGTEVKTVGFNTVVLLFMVLLMNLTTLIKMRYFYE